MGRPMLAPLLVALLVLASAARGTAWPAGAERQQQQERHTGEAWAGRRC